MPSRKQRRRRQKEKRHEYEYVFVDDEGHEVEVEEPESEPKKTRGNGGKKETSKAKGRSAGRPRRQIHPPSWAKSGKRALIFFPLFLLVFSLVSRGSSYQSRFVTALLYTLLFIPLTYLIDRTAYRTYLKRGGAPLESGGRSGRRRG